MLLHMPQPEDSRRVVRFKDYEVDLHNSELRRAGELIPLQQQPFRILAILLEHPGDLVSRQDLQQRLWPDGLHVDFEHSLNRSVNKLRQALGDSAENPELIQTLPGRGYRFVGTLTAQPPERKASAHQPAKVLHMAPPASGDEAVLTASSVFRGALPLNSPYYIARAADDELALAIARADSVVLIKGARQTGKTSLVARALHEARQTEARIIHTDFQMFNAAQLANIDTFLLALAQSMAAEVELGVDPAATWDSRRGASLNFSLFMKRELLGRSERPLIWSLDEVDQIFSCSFANEFFAILRSWHNERALFPETVCRRLTVLVAYAREAHILITDANQSPFNVGTRIVLGNFNRSEVVELNRRYGAPLRDEEVDEFYDLVGGQPFLTQCGLYELAFKGRTIKELACSTTEDNTQFDDHLNRMLLSLDRDPQLRAAVQRLLADEELKSTDALCRLRSAGVLSGDSDRHATLRCRLYRDYFSRNLL